MAGEPIYKKHAVAAPPDLVYQVVVDYEGYPRFFPEFKDVSILDSDGDAKIVEFTASYFGKTVNYTLRIDHDHAARRTSWTYVGGDMKNSEGGWHIQDDGNGGTKIDYRILVEVGFFVPKMISDKAIATSIPEMFAQLDREVARRQSS